MKRTVLPGLLLLGMAIAAFGSAQAQTPPTAQSPRPMLAHTMPIGGDMAKSIRFYGELLGLQAREGDPRAALDWAVANDFLADMYGVNGDYRGIHFLMPRSPFRLAGEEMQIEPIEWKNPKGKPLVLRPQDAGATRIIFQTRDLDRLVGFLKRGAAKIVTTGGAPVAVAGPGGAGRAIVFDDGNNTFVELFQPDKLPEDAVRPAQYVPLIYAADTTITVTDIDRTAQFFRDVMGLEVKVDPSPQADAKRLQVLGLRGGQYREAAVRWPDKTPQLNLIQFTGADQKAPAPPVSGPNASLIRIFVRDIGPVMEKLKAFPDGTIMNVSGAPIERGPASWVIVRLPGSPVYLQLIGLANGRVG